MQLTRVFCFGIGEAVSTALVTGVAHAAGGTAEFVCDGEPMEAKAVAQLEAAVTPALENVRVGRLLTGLPT